MNDFDKSKDTLRFNYAAFEGKGPFPEESGWRCRGDNGWEELVGNEPHGQTLEDAVQRFLKLNPSVWINPVTLYKELKSKGYFVHSQNELRSVSFSAECYRGFKTQEALNTIVNHSISELISGYLEVRAIESDQPECKEWTFSEDREYVQHREAESGSWIRSRTSTFVAQIIEWRFECVKWNYGDLGDQHQPPRAS